MKRQPYEIAFSADADRHMDGLTAGEKRRLFDAVERQLLHEPTRATRHRKPMDRDRRAFVATWELRVGRLRVYYEVEAADRVVLVVAVGVKVRERVRIGSAWIEP